MQIPEGYTKLATVGIAYKGNYSDLETYYYLNTVFYNGSTYIALKDNPTGTPSNDGENWKLVAQGASKNICLEEVTFDEVLNRSNIKSGDTLGVALGKIAKTYNDLKNVAFSGSYNDLTEQPAIPSKPEDIGAVSKTGDTMTGNLTVPQLINNGLTANTVLTANGNKQLISSETTATELGYVHGVTSNIQTQLNEKLTTTGNSANNTVVFASDDSVNPIAWTDVAVLASEEKHSSIFKKVSSMFKNIRYIWKIIGNTNIASIGDGTVTGAIDSLNSKFVYLTEAEYQALGDQVDPDTYYVTPEDPDEDEESETGE